MKKYILLVILLLLSQATLCFADTTTNPNTPVSDRVTNEKQIPPNYFAIAFYKPTYILPYYYTASPYNAVYLNNTPGNEKLRSNEFKYQFSVKVPIIKNIFHRASTLFLGYTQLSYWQLYTHDPFFRESDYEPEIFLANELNYHLGKNLQINLLTLGLSHESNGYGNLLERSWNRFYVDVTSSIGDWMISLRPWYVISTNKNNHNMAKYLGYGEAVFAYKFNEQVVSLTAYNVIEKHARYASGLLTWSIPITPYIKGYAQLFSGYGQSLIEYDHRTNSAGIGIALSDWV